MKPSNVVSAVIVSAALVVAGCSSSSSPKAASSSSSGASASSSAASGAGGASSSSSATSSAAPAASLSATTNSAVGKPILVDAAGRTVYMYDPQGTSTTSQVPAGIRSSWPALTASAMPTAGAGADGSKIVLQPQADGTSQISYNGHLLYTFVGDSAPGDANGQALGGIWFTLSPAGEKNP